MMGFSLCLACTRFTHNEEGLEVCEAYPDGIPEEILLGAVDHREPYDGDQGILFENDGFLTDEQITERLEISRRS